MTAEPTPDGNLPAALSTLHDAIAALIDPQAGIVHGELRYTHSRYQELSQAVGKAGQSKATFASRPGGIPLWPDAFDLLNDINRTINSWQPPATNYEWWFGTPHPDDTRPRAVRQLAGLPHCKWRPQDCHLIAEHGGDVQAWVRRIDALLSDEHHGKHLTAPCPACDTRTVYRTTGGERVRQAALQIDALGCHCLQCHARWSPEYFVHLARVIGCPIPAGVLE